MSARSASRTGGGSSSGSRIRKAPSASTGGRRKGKSHKRVKRRRRKVVRAYKQTTSFLVFCSENRSQIRESNPTLNFAQIAVELGRAWKALSEAEREQFKTKADAANAAAASAAGVSAGAAKSDAAASGDESGGESEKSGKSYDSEFDDFIVPDSDAEESASSRSSDSDDSASDDSGRRTRAHARKSNADHKSEAAAAAAPAAAAASAVAPAATITSPQRRRKRIIADDDANESAATAAAASPLSGPPSAPRSDDDVPLATLFSAPAAAARERERALTESAGAAGMLPLPPTAAMTNPIPAEAAAGGGGGSDGCWCILRPVRGGGPDIRVTSSKLTFGRARTATVQISDLRVSQLHCSVDNEFSGFFRAGDTAVVARVTDMSRNGTFINGRRMGRKTVAVSPGDRIGLIHMARSSTPEYEYMFLGPAGVMPSAAASEYIASAAAGSGGGGSGGNGGGGGGGGDGLPAVNRSSAPSPRLAAALTQLAEIDWSQVPDIQPSRKSDAAAEREQLKARLSERAADAKTRQSRGAGSGSGRASSGGAGGGGGGGDGDGSDSDDDVRTLSPPPPPGISHKRPRSAYEEPASNESAMPVARRSTWYRRPPLSSHPARFLPPPPMPVPAAGSGGGGSYLVLNAFTCGVCTFENPSGRMNCEMCGTARADTASLAAAAGGPVSLMDLMHAPSQSRAAAGAGAGAGAGGGRPEWLRWMADRIAGRLDSAPSIDQRSLHPELYQLLATAAVPHAPLALAALVRDGHTYESLLAAASASVSDLNTTLRLCAGANLRPTHRTKLASELVRVAMRRGRVMAAAPLTAASVASAAAPPPLVTTTSDFSSSAAHITAGSVSSAASSASSASASTATPNGATATASGTVSRGECVVCLERPIGVIILPCFHLVLCVECSQHVMKPKPLTSTPTVDGSASSSAVAAAASGVVLATAALCPICSTPCVETHPVFFSVGTSARITPDTGAAGGGGGSADLPSDGFPVESDADEDLSSLIDRDSQFYRPLSPVSSPNSSPEKRKRTRASSAAGSARAAATAPVRPLSPPLSQVEAESDDIPPLELAAATPPLATALAPAAAAAGSGATADTAIRILSPSPPRTRSNQLRVPIAAAEPAPALPAASASTSASATAAAAPARIRRLRSPPRSPRAVAPAAPPTPASAPSSSAAAAVEAVSVTKPKRSSDRDRFFDHFAELNDQIKTEKRPTRKRRHRASPATAAAAAATAAGDLAIPKLEADPSTATAASSATAPAAAAPAAPAASSSFGEKRVKTEPKREPKREAVMLQPVTTSRSRHLPSAAAVKKQESIPTPAAAAVTLPHYSGKELFSGLYILIVCGGVDLSHNRTQILRTQITKRGGVALDRVTPELTHVILSPVEPIPSHLHSYADRGMCHSPLWLTESIHRNARYVDSAFVVDTATLPNIKAEEKRAADEIDAEIEAAQAQAKSRKKKGSSAAAKAAASSNAAAAAMEIEDTPPKNLTPPSLSVAYEPYFAAAVAGEPVVKPEPNSAAAAASASATSRGAAAASGGGGGAGPISPQPFDRTPSPPRATETYGGPAAATAAGGAEGETENEYTPPAATFADAPDTAAGGKPPGWSNAFLEPGFTLPANPRVDNARDFLACQMPSAGVVNHNPEITRELERLEAIYRACGDKWREYTFRKAGGIIKRHPKPIVGPDDFKALSLIRGFGAKMVAKVTEIVNTGSLQRRALMENDPRVKALGIFSRIFGVGPAAAQKLYAKGYRTLDDVKAHMNELNAQQQIGVTHYHDLIQRIPRDECTALVDVVKAVATRLLPGVTVVCCGSYRRGRPNAGDCDILITHRDPATAIQEKRKELLQKLLAELKAMDPPFLVGTFAAAVRIARCSVRHITRRVLADLGSSKERKEIQDIYMGCGRLASTHLPKPGPGAVSGLVRRVDIKIYPAMYFPFALLYFTGSDHFNRSMRYYAKRKGFTLSDHGLSQAVRVKGEKVWTGKSAFCRTERDVFDALGLRYVPPKQRNCYQSFDIEKDQIEKQHQTSNDDEFDEESLNGDALMRLKREKFKIEAKEAAAAGAGAGPWPLLALPPSTAASPPLPPAAASSSSSAAAAAAAAAAAGDGGGSVKPERSLRAPPYPN